MTNDANCSDMKLLTVSRFILDWLTGFPVSTGTGQKSHSEVSEVIRTLAEQDVGYRILSVTVISTRMPEWELDYAFCTLILISERKSVPWNNSKNFTSWEKMMRERNKSHTWLQTSLINSLVLFLFNLQITVIVESGFEKGIILMYPLQRISGKIQFWVRV